MLLIILYTLIKKHNPQDLIKIPLKIGSYLKVIITKLLIHFILRLIAIIPFLSMSQNSQIDYKVIYSGNNIGWLRLEKKVTGNKSDLVLLSEIKTKIIFPITVYSKEFSSFENGKLIYSSQYRKTNGTTKVNKEIRFIDNEYEVKENNKKTKLSFTDINTNLLSLYFQEPKNCKEVYCDIQQCFVKVTKADDGGYKIKLPNGNCNSYYYKEGVCVKVKVEHKFYVAEIIINP